jgi:hypothetical protein
VPLHIRLLTKRAKEAGFTTQSLNRLLTFLNLSPPLTLDQVRAVLPYVNRRNAPKFTYEEAVCPLMRKPV